MKMAYAILVKSRLCVNLLRLACGEKANAIRCCWRAASSSPFHSYSGTRVVLAANGHAGKASIILPIWTDAPYLDDLRSRCLRLQLVFFAGLLLFRPGGNFFDSKHISCYLRRSIAVQHRLARERVNRQIRQRLRIITVHAAI